MSSFKYDDKKVLNCAKLVLEKCDELSKFSKNERRKFVNQQGKELSSSKNGVYLFVELDKMGKTTRIVRVGTHTSEKTTILDRLRCHFIDSVGSSIFRKQVAKSISNKDNGYTEDELQQVTDYINRFRIIIIEENSKEKRLEIERQLIGTLSWAGFFSEDFRKVDEIMQSSSNEFTKDYGLWLKEEMFTTPIEDENKISEIFSKGVKI